jgi:hypothetical protein
MNQTGGTSPSTLVQLAVGSVPPIDPQFFDLINNFVDTSVPVPANEMMRGGDYYREKYLKYKQKYLSLRRKMLLRNQ